MRRVSRISMIISLAVLSVGSLAMLTGCEGDDSLPTRPRTAAPLVDPGAQERAEKRALENPGKAVPTGGSGDAPRQLNSISPVENRQVVTLAAGGPVAAGATMGDSNRTGAGEPLTWNAIGDWHGPTATHSRDLYDHGIIPHLPATGTRAPMQGSAAVPGTDWAVDFSWGQVMALSETPHRNWPELTVNYQIGNVKHDPMYYFSMQEQLPVPQNDGTCCGNWVQDVIDVPWFYLNTAALPVLMIFEPPFNQRTTDRASIDPVYRGNLPAGGPVVPSMAPGVLHWEYPFLNPDGSVKDKNASTNPTPTPTRAPNTP